MKLSELHTKPKKRKIKSGEEERRIMTDIVMNQPNQAFVTSMSGTDGHSGRPINYLKNKR